MLLILKYDNNWRIMRRCSLVSSVFFLGENMIMKSLTSKIWGLVKLLTCLMLAAQSAPAIGAPILINGSLSGMIDNKGVPSGWMALNGSPDTMDENNNLGLPSEPFGATPSASPDGGTWVGFADEPTSGGDHFPEILGQSVTGFEIGFIYSVSWYQANFGFPEGSIYLSPDSIGMSVDSDLVGLSSISALASGWTLETLQFIASNATHTLSFGVSGAIGSSYMSIDGISIADIGHCSEFPEGCPSAKVPTPPTILLFGIGLIGLGFARRRQA
jgi:hypothetical protein